MATISKVSMDIKKRIMSSWNFRDTRQARILLENRMEDLNVERLDDSIDVHGKPLRKYSPGYVRFKSKFISGKVKQGRKKTFKTTRSRARKVYDYGRLRGQTIEKIIYKAKVQVLRDRIRFTMETIVKDREAIRIIGSLHNLGYDFYSGLANPRSPRGQKELEDVKKLLINNMDYFKGL